MLTPKVPFERKASPGSSGDAAATLPGFNAGSVGDTTPAYAVAYENEQLMSRMCDVLRDLVSGEDELLVWRRPFRWHCDRGAIPNGYEMFELDELAQLLQMEVVHDFRHAGVLRRRAL
jgi:hypothetical protein